MDEDGLTINEFIDEMAFTMDPNLIDWSFIDDIDTSNPSSAKYRTMMKELGLLRNGPRNMWSYYY